MASSTPKTQHTHNNRSTEWTSEMRDRQARGKNPYVEESDASDAEPMRLGGHIAESHMERERRGEAMFVLDNPEALMAHAQASGDSIAGQRLRFMRQLCGFDNDKYDDTSTSSSSTRNTKRRVSDRVNR
ncbi:hypothetical protein FGSG_00331 [Fusarium graminearum PH-1]|uniref:Uncharacterized protein n=1 Tax=Gibberella zeae (strain ATCC MYA-4620 / CBS 123657 / FGSC 9075 / NRRL 31084 / PH-1) TaxID=229533 RepID=I1RA14_GIBZE|nr:hypothetical protein FGSG_00331 [Fusarium graminearum PH-1]ESU05496.1 hypothetical protein FGSG_00331 [Fusarium graminearum PH-1]|eukprot:XP_011315981.1 hypothetical protein FGSG_00331 [Fusarium graminearum PH-1]